MIKHFTIKHDGHLYEFTYNDIVEAIKSHKIEAFRPGVTGSTRSVFDLDMLAENDDLAITDWIKSNVFPEELHYKFHQNTYDQEKKFHDAWRYGAWTAHYSALAEVTRFFTRLLKFKRTTLFYKIYKLIRSHYEH